MPLILICEENFGKRVEGYAENCCSGGLKINVENHSYLLSPKRAKLRVYNAANLADEIHRRPSKSV